MGCSSFLGTGFSFPVMPDSATGRFMSSSFEEDIKEAIYIILMTKKGERLMRPDFGCGIHDFAFATLDYTTVSQMEKSIKEALIKWEPRIRDISVEVSQDTPEDGKALFRFLMWCVQLITRITWYFHSLLMKELNCKNRKEVCRWIKYLI